MKKDKLIINVSTMITLISLNYHIWINELKTIVEKARVWKYVDLDIDVEEFQSSESFIAADYLMMKKNATRSAVSLKKLIAVQREEYKADMLEYNMLEKLYERTIRELQTIDNAIRTSAQQYILFNELRSFARKIIKLLAARYKLNQSKIIQQIHEQWRKLNTSSVKNKVESWVTEWENLRLQMISLKLADTFDDDVIFVSEFLHAERRWASTFCDNWENQLKTAEKSVDFFKITRAYRLVVIRKNSSSSRIVNAATLQDVTQDQVTFNQKNQRSINKRKSKKNNHSHKKKNEKCICEKEHSFKKCSYIVSLNRKKEWKENKKIRNEMREQIRNRLMIHRAISKMININILDEFSDSWIKKSKSENISSTTELEASFRFDNMTLLSQNEIHSLYKNVIYESECSDFFTFDRNRFVDEIRSADEEIRISNELINVVDYETIIVNDKLSNKIVKLKFANTIWISSTDVILISFTRLIKKKYDRDLHINILMHMKSDTKICEISMHCNVLLLKFNFIKHANSIQSRKFTTIKTTSWFWHLRLDRCRLEIIHQLKKIDDIEMIKRNKLSKTLDCETCVVSKMHRLMQKIFAERAIKSYEILHFDIIIFKKKFDFDETFCIIHFIDEFTSFNWVFSLIDHQEKTLMSMFKSLINRCDKAELIINSMMKKIRSEQKTSIDLQLKNWINNQNIEWDWSSKYTLEQNDKSERFDALLIEKARCIREFSKLSKDLYPECCLAVVQLLNRILMTQLSWDSSLIRLQRLLKKSIKWKLDHLKIFDCKTYVLLKESDVSSRSEKMKARAFVDYLVDYDSIIIFRIWNLEKDDVSDYKDAIFDENAYYDSYDKNKRHLTKKSERNLMQFRIYSIKSVVNVELLNRDEKWLKTFVRNKLMLKNRKERSIEIAEEMKKSIQMNDDLRQLFTSLESSFSQHLSSQIISLRFELTEDDRISRFH